MENDGRKLQIIEKRLNQFIFWLESRGDYLGEGTEDVTHSNDEDEEESV